MKRLIEATLATSSTPLSPPSKKRKLEPKPSQTKEILHKPAKLGFDLEALF